MPATVRSLLAKRDFRITVASGVRDSSVLDREIVWVHSSDLSDPTPWLEPGQLLLTDGVQFLGDQSPASCAKYVARLQERGLVGLGFATQIAHDTIPVALIAACDGRGFPLLEVAERTPFMAIIRYVADVISADQRERLEWLLDAQRAVARAALRPDGLDVILHELERQLDAWIEFYDATGTRIDAGTQRRLPEPIEPEVTSAARQALRKGLPAGMRIETSAGGATLQTLGQRGHLLGVLAVGASAPLDAAETDLVASVIGLASIALEQSRTLETARLRVRAGMLELLVAGIIDVADDTAKRLWGSLPSPPLRVAVISGHSAPALLNVLELQAERSQGRLFFAERDDEVVIIAPDADAALLGDILGQVEAEAGVSAPVDWNALNRGLTEARQAGIRSTPGRPVVLFESLADEGVLGLLTTADAEPLARRMLEPVIDSPNPDHRVLLKTAAVWIEHNGAWDPAARKLNVHRHTLRNRLHTLETLLSLDFSRFSDRAELWAALQYVDYPGKTARS